MAEAAVVVTAGSGTSLHSNTRTISASTMHDQYVLPGEYPYASYFVVASTISIATVNDHVLQIMAGSSLNVRIRRIRIEQDGNASTAAQRSFSILRLTTAGTGGSTVTARPFDTADAASGATAMTLPSSKGTEGVVLMQTVIIMRQAIGTTTAQPDDGWEWIQHPGTKPLIIAAGTSNGIAIKNLTATAGASLTVNVELVETAFV